MLDDVLRHGEAFGVSLRFLTFLRRGRVDPVGAEAAKSLQP